MPILENPFCEEIFPSIQIKPPLVQFETISCCSVACNLREETDTHFSTDSILVGVERGKVSP